MSFFPSEGEALFGCPKYAAANMEDTPTECGGSIYQNMDGVEPGDMEENVVERQSTKKVKVPRRIIHFASGETMEEYSTDEEEEEPEQPEVKAPPPKDVGPYVWFHLSKAAYSTLYACDYLGEKFADLLGMSSAKYQYAIDQHDRQKKEEERKKKESQLPEESERRIDQVRSEEYWDDQMTSQDVSDSPAGRSDSTCEIASEKKLPFESHANVDIKHLVQDLLKNNYLKKVEMLPK